MGRIIFVSPSGLRDSSRKKRRTTSKGFTHNMPHLVSADTAVLAIPAEAYITFFGLKGQAGKLTKVQRVNSYSLYHFPEKPCKQVMALSPANENSLVFPMPLTLAETTEI